MRCGPEGVSQLKRAIRVAIPFIVAALVASACGGAGTGGTKPAITIGSTNFSEQLVLGELYSQVLEANGYTVTRKFNLGAREIVFPALQSGQIDIRLLPKHITGKDNAHVDCSNSWKKPGSPKAVARRDPLRPGINCPLSLRAPARHARSRLDGGSLRRFGE